MSDELLKPYIEPTNQFARQLGIQNPVFLATEESAKSQGLTDKDESHILIFQEGDEPDPSDIAFILAKARLAERYNPIFNEAQLSKQYHYHPNRENIEKTVSMIQRTSDIWAMDLMAIHISPEIVQGFARKKIDSFSVIDLGIENVIEQPYRTTVYAGFLHAIKKRYDLEGYDDIMKLLSVKISRIIPDFEEGYRSITDDYISLPQPLESSDEMIDILEDTARRTTAFLGLEFKPALRIEDGSLRWFLDPVNHRYM